MTDAHDFPLFVLREYAVAADGERGMLIGPRGDIVWLCAPRWDSDAVFSHLIGGGGIYAVTPTVDAFVWGGHYDDGSLIWRNRWTTPTQTIECRDALAYPGDRDTAVILRRIMAGDHDAELRVVLDLQSGFGKHRLTHAKEHEGVWTGRTGPLHARWSGAGAAVHHEDGSFVFTVTVKAGQHLDLVLELSEEPLGDPVNVDEAWRVTEAAWDDAVPPVTGTLDDADVRHSLAVLHGLTTKGGGMVAGATMSLPERFGDNRNYDYRYAWIRDQCYAGQAAASVGDLALLDDAVTFVTGRLLNDGANLKPAYTTDGGPVPDERKLGLPGYPGGTDKIGNWVNKQFQLDAFGEALLLLACAAHHDRLDQDGWKAVETAVTVIADTHGQPEAGIWELDDQIWTHSRLSCVAGLRAIAKHASTPDAAPWSALADTILAATGKDCVHPTGRWQRTPTDTRIDSALLIPAVRGALPADDPRTVATLDAALQDLGGTGYMYRFRQSDGPLGDSEGAFLLCGFMTSLALHQQHRPVEAARWFERNRAARGTPGVFSEEYDVAQRQMRGNLPQAFVHALFIETAATLGASDDTSPGAHL